jgi:hypothetical protein
MNLPKNFKIKINDIRECTMTQKLLFSRGFRWGTQPTSVKSIECVGLVIRGKNIFYSNNLINFQRLKMPEISWTLGKTISFNNTLTIKYLL